MQDTTVDLKSLSSEQLCAREHELDQEVGRALEGARSRPRTDAEFFRRAMWDPKARSDLKARQDEWDAANPAAAEAWRNAERIEDARDQVRFEIERRRRQRDERERVLSVLDEVPRVRALVEKGLNPSPAHDAVQEWARTKSWCLLLLGGVGCGKSSAAGAFAVKFGEDGGKAGWVRAVEASRLSAFGAEAEARFQAWRTIGCLVLDDLGTELMTPTWQQALDDVLDYRYQHSLRTVLPSNLSAEEFKSRYGDRISDRIRHDGTVRLLDAKSLRKRGAS